MATARVRVLVVTWNRKSFVENLLRSLGRQTYPRELMDVTVIDNASTDGTLEHLREQFRPEHIVHNDTDLAHEPRFRRAPEVVVVGRTAAQSKNSLGFGSLTIVRNRTNVGGCGGFNTGFAFAEWASRESAPSAETRPAAPPSAPARDRRPAHASALEPDYLWLVDDDADVPTDALEQLTRVMSSSDDIGLVGSRTVNIADRTTTIETTIYYNFWTGAMQDDCPPENPKREPWLRWVEKSGGTRGLGRDGKPLLFSGQVDVDVVSACSMLARWGAITGTSDRAKSPVGFWDWRYFIYCDDADWCLRFARSGWRVVLALDAVVYHTPWNLKLTPARIYYANRNKVWMGQKVLQGRQLRQVTTRAMKSMLRDSLHAAWHRRLFHANIILDTARDIVIQRWGKTGSDGPTPEPILPALRRLGLLRRGATVGLLCSQPDSIRWAFDFKTQVEAEIEKLPATERIGLPRPEYLIIARNDVPGAVEGAGTIIYGRHRKSKLKKQFFAARHRPDALVVFDQTNDFPVLLAGGVNLHIDLKKPTMVQVERDGWIPRLAFMLRWIPTAARCLWFARTVKPHRSQTRYG